MTSRLKISYSIGRNGRNIPDDVRIIQRLLNQHIQPDLAALEVDGIVGPKTRSAIHWFQKERVGMRNPDSRVDPDGKTIKKLYERKRKDQENPLPNVQRPASNIRRVRAEGDPVPIDVKTADTLITTKTKLSLGGIWGDVLPGDTWLGTDGSRLVLSASYSGVIFLLNTDGRIYLQSAQGFAGEVTTYPFVEAGRRAAPMARLIELELQFLLGVVGTTSGIGFVAVMSSTVLQFVVENRQNFKKWSAILEASLEARSQLKKYAPTLYDNVFDATILIFVKNVLPNAPGAINRNAVAKAAGAIVGGLGKKAAQGKFSAVAVVAIILTQFAMKCLTALPKAIDVTVGEHKQSSEKILEALRSAGTEITRDEVQKIFEEIRDHPKEIFEALNKVAKAANLHSAPTPS